MQCRINNGANGAAAPGPPQLGAPHKGFFCTLILPGTLFEANFIYIIAKMRSLPDPAGGLTAPPRPPAVLHAASGSVGLGHRGSHSPREKPPTKVLHQAPHIGNPALGKCRSGSTLPKPPVTSVTVVTPAHDALRAL